MLRFRAERIAARPLWLQRGERGSAAAMRLLAWVTFAFGRGIARSALYPICAYFLIFSFSSRRASRDYLGRALGRPARLSDVFRHYHTFASTVHDRLYLLAGRHGEFEIDLQADAHTKRLMHGEKGCILLGAHLGSFEILRAYGAAHHARPINVMMHVDNAAKTNRLVDSLAPQLRARIIPLGRPESLLRVQDCLARGEVVGILGDRVWGNDRTVSCDFLGRAAHFPAGPLLLAALLGAPVVLFFGIYRGGRRYEICLESFAERIVLDRAGREAALQTWIHRYARRLEHHCRVAPYNWFNFYDFWR